jgi:hypothetical protein
VPATYGLTIRGTANGVPDALTGFNLTVNVSGVSLALGPASVSLFPGSSTLATLSINRVSYTGAIALSAEGVPAGVTVAPNPVSVLGASSNVTVSVSSAAVPGTYPVTIRAVPAGWPPGLSLTIPLPVTVRDIPAGAGNVLLDWNDCMAPEWVAYRNGDGPWTRVVPDDGVVSFLVSAARGGYAWVEAGSGNVSVRFNTQAELTSGPIAMCPPPPFTGKTIVGQGVHTGAAESVIHALGGATATSSLAAPGFTLSNVRDGVHDLVSFGTSALGTRAYLRRDVDLPDGGSLGFVDLVGTGSFLPQSVTLNVFGTLAGEVVSHGLNFLTTSACTANPMYAGRIGSGQVMSAVPTVLQRTDDFHQVVVTAIGSGRTRIVASTFRNLTTRSITLPGTPGNPTVASVPAPYKVLQVTVSGFPIVYDRTISFRYSSALRSMSVSASVAYTGTGTTTLAMPDFSTMDGWPAGAGMGVDESGSWNLSLEGGMVSTPLCTDNRITYFFSQTGNF